MPHTLLQPVRAPVLCCWFLGAQTHSDVNLEPGDLDQSLSPVSA